MIKTVLVVDDSPVACKLLTTLINKHPEFNVIGTASNAYEAKDFIQSNTPDMITLDVQMPKMDGLTFLSSLMRNKPVPTLMISSLTTSGAHKTLEALEMGAIEYIGKPKITNEEELEQYKDELHEKLTNTANIPLSYLHSKQLQLRGQIPKSKKMEVNSSNLCKDTVIAMCGGTGGTDACRVILEHLPPNTPPILISQNLPPAYLPLFAQRLGETTGFKTLIATDGMKLLSGHVYLRPPKSKMEMVVESGERKLKVTHMSAMKFNPNDHLFASVGGSSNGSAICVGLSSGDTDGVEGLKVASELGCHCIGQDKSTSVSDELVSSARQRNAISEIVRLNKIAQIISIKLDESKR